MYVTFRRVVSDGAPPVGAAAEAIYRECIGCRRYFGGERRCQKRPRCRYRIGGLKDADGQRHPILVPYRLNVAVVESQRQDGKVKQTHVANLGSIAGVWLPEFWRDVPASLKRSAWDQHSVSARQVFWIDARAVLVRLGNRLGREGCKALAAAIAERIPIPTAAEIWSLSIFNDEHELEGADMWRELGVGRIKRNRNLIAKCEKEIAETAAQVAEVERQMEAMRSQIKRKRLEGWR